MNRIILVAAFSLAITFAVAAETYPWQEPQARVLPTGSLTWSPRAFTYQPGPSVRYIDFEKGSDQADGLSPDTAWQHHPWDAAATDKAAGESGIHTYVFKGGVIYRGELKADESGQPGNPIRLTRDPAWGSGPAQIYGSRPIRGGWQRCGEDDAPGIPQPESLWMNDLGADFDRDKPGLRLSALWRVRGDMIERLHIARAPDWSENDPLDPTGDWYRWKTFTGTGARGWLADPEHWRGVDPALFHHARIWTQHGSLMGSVHALAPQQVDPKKGAFLIRSPGGANYRRFGGKPDQPYNLRGRVRYYVENVRSLLDTPGEYFYEVDGPRAGRLYLRLAQGEDPNDSTFEAAAVRSPIAIFDQSHIEVSGLSFRFNDDDDGLYGYPWHISASPMVRIVGTCREITVSHCAFEHVMNAVVAFPRPRGTGGPAKASIPDIGEFADDVMEEIAITDNDVLHNDMAGAIWVEGCSQRSRDDRYGVVRGVSVLRNRVVHCGFRPGKSPTSSIPAISVILPETAHIAGNIVQSSWGNGIFTLGGKKTRAVNDVPLARILIHHNQLENTMLGCNDYGGLEIFQGGPAYIYNNVVRNAVGSRTFTGTPLGYNLYLDGGFKIASFNNILAGPDGGHAHCGYFMVFGFLDHFFHNTVCGFEYGMNGSSGNRSAIVGNVVMDCTTTFMGQNRPGDVSMEFGGDTGEMGRRGIATMAYGSNVFYGSPAGDRKLGGAFGYVGGTQGPVGAARVVTGDTLEELRDGLAGMQCRLGDIGVHSDRPPLRDPAKRDYRPTPDSAAHDRGVRFFVPWALSRVVGEWHFTVNPAAPETVLGENFYMTDEYLERGMYYFIPRQDLTVAGATAEDYVAGTLEDWIPGALHFDGTRRAVLTHDEMAADRTYPLEITPDGQVGRGKGPYLYEGNRRQTVDVRRDSFLLELVFRTAPGSGEAGLVWMWKTNAGYGLSLDGAGKPVLTLGFEGLRGIYSADQPLNDGEWHHLLVEIDRRRNVVRFYRDGGPDGERAIELPARSAFTCEGDFVVGADPEGHRFEGDMDFLRVSRGTLADARTTIGELYAWEFDGPFLRDFTGRKPDGKRDAGAMEGR